MILHNVGSYILIAVVYMCHTFLYKLNSKSIEFYQQQLMLRDWLLKINHIVSSHLKFNDYKYNVTLLCFLLHCKRFSQFSDKNNSVFDPVVDVLNNQSLINLVIASHCLFVVYQHLLLESSFQGVTFFLDNVFEFIPHICLAPYNP